MINDFYDKNVYNLLLFALYRLSDNPKYSTLSELIYLFDKPVILKLLNYFGGLTITIPTIDELIELINVLVIYQDVEFNGKTIAQSIEENHLDTSEYKVVELYDKIKEILKDYD